MGRNWELAHAAFAKEQGVSRDMQQWFLSGWQAAHKHFPGTMHGTVEACEAEFARYRTISKADSNKAWGPEDWFTQGYWRFQAWVNNQLEQAYAGVEVDNR